MNSDNWETNGRVDIIAPLHNPVNFADRIPVKTCESFRDALTGTWTNTPLSILFFSLENIKNLQNTIKRGVYDKSNKQFLIGPQDCDELKIIMRSIFFQYSKNLPNDIKDQIKMLNHRVVCYAVNQVYNDAISYLKYKRDASYIYTIPPAPIYSSCRDKTLELKPFF